MRNWWVIRFFNFEERYWDTRIVWSTTTPEHAWRGPFMYESEAQANC